MSDSPVASWRDGPPKSLYLRMKEEGLTLEQAVNMWRLTFNPDIPFTNASGGPTNRLLMAIEVYMKFECGLPEKELNEQFRTPRWDWRWTRDRDRWETEDTA